MKIYKKQWELFYQKTYGEKKSRALWDVNHEHAAVLDYEKFAPYFDKDLPLIDIGCGTGAQTCYFAGHYPQVFGFDVSPQAIKLAKENNSRVNLQYHVYDGTDESNARNWYEKTGEANIYMRGVLHQINSEDFPGFLNSFKTFLGLRGKAFIIEVSDQLPVYLRKKTQTFSNLPPALQKVRLSSLPAQGINKTTLKNKLELMGFNIIFSEDYPLKTNLHFDSDEELLIPGFSVCFENNSLQ